MTALALLIPVAAILYALGAGVWALFWFNHRESAICQVTSEAGPFDGGRNYYWKITTSCGTYIVNQGDFDLDKSKADDLANELRIDGNYKLTFLGWGTGREIVAAQLLAG
jgi:hypothetical protein